MAIGKIRTFLGPQATADRRAHEERVLSAKNEVKLARETTKQVQAGGAEAIWGLKPTPPTLAEVVADALKDPTVQMGAAAVAALGLLSVVMRRKRKG